MYNNNNNFDRYTLELRAATNAMHQIHLPAMRSAMGLPDLVNKTQTHSLAHSLDKTFLSFSCLCEAICDGESTRVHGGSEEIAKVARAGQLAVGERNHQSVALPQSRVYRSVDGAGACTRTAGCSYGSSVADVSHTIPNELCGVARSRLCPCIARRSTSTCQL